MTAPTLAPVEEPGDAVRPDRLLARADHGLRRADGLRVRAARSLVLGLLRKMSRDRLTVDDYTPGGLRRTSFGSGNGDDEAHLQATLEIHDGRAWTALVAEGSIGLGRGYLEGWWDSDDPVAVVRIIIRNIEWFDELRNRLTATTGWATNRVRAALPKPGRSRNKEDIASHYDLGNEFFQIFLDETMTYSSAVFPSAEMALAEASHHKYDRILSKLGVTADHSVLEIGSGWGGFALRAVDTLGCRVTTTTISDEQLDEATHRIHKAGRSAGVEVLDADWRDLTGRFDRVASIEMIEAVDWRDYDRYFATIERCMKPDGLAAIQAICVPDRRYERTKNTEDFIRRFVFPGGFLPSIGAISRSTTRATKLQIVDVEDLSAHYAETLRRWRERFDERIDEVKALGLDDRFCRLWRFYLAYCEAGFAERHCTVNQIVFAGPRWRPDGLALRAG
ncbi:MAG: class I SAM-dependent methyltransferase [Actinomycetia bacterium]|nr:class I SAM-dependent methyltransferase [Actinomycetes bacterium]